jgi:two-component system CheB/CheR fusion protein
MKNNKGGNGKTRVNNRAPKSEGGKRSGPTAVVGLGASAGGIEALQGFFEKMPPDSGLAFVVVMHLSPEHESNLASVLQTATGMKVVQVENHAKVQPNCVYVIPPNKHLSMSDSHLVLSQPQQAPGRRVAIDLFFRTLAEAYGPRAVCALLSGTDSDGVIGLKHIKAQGGVTIAQEPNEAAYDSMPRAAIETGMVDWIIPVRDMPGKLVEFVHNERRIQLPPEQPDGEKEEQEAPGQKVPAKETRETEDEKALQEVLSFLRNETGHDFSHYKRATILRRVARRLQVNCVESIPEYLGYLRSHAAEAHGLLRDLLIGVTNFFRDRDAFAALETHIPQLFTGKSTNDEVRVWVTGCATGEEAYSIAMLLCEQAGRLESPPSIQVFATDIDGEAIADARDAIYPVTIEADVSMERLRRFFVLDQGRYRVKKEVREAVLFAAHDILRDAPFSRLDLVSCRNLMIYLRREAQERLLDVFHFSLRPGGLLFVGGSETVDEAQALFASVDLKHRIFVRRSAPRPGWMVPHLAVRPPALPRVDPALPRHRQPPPITDLTGPVVPGQSQERRAFLFGELHLKLLEQYAPPSLVINDKLDVVHLSENPGRYLQFRGGEASANFLELIHPDIRLQLRSAIFRANHQGHSVTLANLAVHVGDETELTDVHVRPLAQKNERQDFTLIVFEKKSAGLPPEPLPPGATEPLNQHLETELLHIKQQLGASIEQYEAANEELKASNEELQAMNEELRSSAEELETSKEELQSVNEELITVNHELKGKVEELSRANSDLQNLMASTGVGTVFLDRELRIKRFTAEAQKIFNLIPGDIGRPLTDITHKLHYDQFISDAEEVLRSLRQIEREVPDGGDTWFAARMNPYRTIEDKIDGVVISFIDITARKRAENDVARQMEKMRKVFEVEAVGVVFFTVHGAITDANDAFLRMSGYTREDLRKGLVRWDRMTPPEYMNMTLEAMEDFKSGSHSRTYEKEYIHKDGSRWWGLFTGAPFNEEEGIKYVIDITDRKQAAQRLLDANRQQSAMYEFVRRRHEARSIEEINEAALDAILDILPCDRASILLFDPKGKMRFVASRGLSENYRKAASGHSPWRPNAVDPNPVTIEDLAKSDLPRSLKSAVKREGIASAAFVPLSVDSVLIGKFMAYYDRPHEFSDSDLKLAGTIAGQLALGIERIRSEAALREANERFRLLVEGARGYAIFMLDPTNVITHWNKGAERVFGWTAEEAIGKSGKVIFTPEDRRNKMEEKEIEQALRTGQAADRRWHLRKDGTRIWVDGIMHRIDDERIGALRGFAKIARDATADRVAQQELERRVAERTAELTSANRKLRNEMDERLRLEQRVLEVSEREKRRIGDDLHDSLCQELAATAFFLETQAKKLEKTRPRDATPFAEAARLVNKNVGFARDLARGLHPVGLRAGGLPNALRELAFRTSQHNVACRCDCARGVRVPDQAVSLNLYRIAAEAVTNSIKHGKPRNIVITLRRTGSALVLQVRDDGKGFKVQSQRKGMGLEILYHRANVIGGQLQVESRTGAGTTVTCTLPGE